MEMLEKFHSLTYGPMTREQVFNKIAEAVASGEQFEITIGTDSQTYSKSKIITVIAVHRVGKGGFFFWNTEYVPPMRSPRLKLYHETYKSLELAKMFSEFLVEWDLDVDLAIHVDMGKSKKGKTAELIAEISGWVMAEGFVCHHKPDSYAASCIADRLSK